MRFPTQDHVFALARRILLKLPATMLQPLLKFDTSAPQTAAPSWVRSSKRSNLAEGAPMIE
jgi:hypothetical protein